MKTCVVFLSAPRITKFPLRGVLLVTFLFYLEDLFHHDDIFPRKYCLMCLAISLATIPNNPSTTPAAFQAKKRWVATFTWASKTGKLQHGSLVWSILVKGFGIAIS